jgi:hypothetical protein
MNVKLRRYKIVFLTYCKFETQAIINQSALGTLQSYHWKFLIYSQMIMKAGKKNIIQVARETDLIAIHLQKEQIV